MTKQYTLAEVVELQNQRQQLNQRMEVHSQRAIEKQKELNALYASEGVTNIQELSELCSKTNQEMQEFAAREEQVIMKMKEQCDALDGML
jgi:hypothetical protein